MPRAALPGPLVLGFAVHVLLAGACSSAPPSPASPPAGTAASGATTEAATPASATTEATPANNSAAKPPHTAAKNAALDDHAQAQRTACSTGDTAACAELVRACDAGGAKACVELASLHRTGSGVSKDDKTATELFERACQVPNGPLDGCVELASAYCSGMGVARDTRKGVELVLQLCGDGFAPGCSLAGLYHSEGLCDVPYNDGSFALGAELYRRGCDLGHYGACAHLGSMTRAGRGVPRDPAKGRALLERACSHGEHGACLELRQP